MSNNNKGLVEFVKRALAERWGYVWGTFGQVLTESLLNQKAKQYPSGVGNYLSFIKHNWLGRKTSDCAGLIKAYNWTRDNEVIYEAKTDLSADGMFNNAIEKGTINTIPDIPGICVWKKDHIGVYIGGGEVIEARGTKYGVIKTPLKGSGSTGWTHWLKCPFIDYVAEEAPKLTPAPVTVDGDSWIKVLQEGLNEAGFTDENGNKLDVDGRIGEHTRAAAKKCVVKPGMKGKIVKFIQHFVGAKVDGSYGEPPKYHDTYDYVCSFQRSKKLQIDGKIGTQTWTSILG